MQNQCDPFKILLTFFKDLEKIILKFTWKNERPRIPKPTEK